MNNTMAMTILTCGEYHVSLWLHTSANPTPEQWSQGVERIAEVKRKLAGDVNKFRTLAISDGGAPNTVQRGALFTDLLEGKSKAAGVTCQLSNRLLRGVATAISWLNPNFRAYPPEHFNQALQYLDVLDHRSQLVVALQQLQKSVAPVQSLTIAVAS